MEEKQNNNGKEFSLETVIASAVKVPGVKVIRRDFLAATFSSDPSQIEEILELGPVETGIGRETLNKLAKSLIWKRTAESSAASLGLGTLGGVAMAATLPADILQFYGMALRLAQELSYLYGAPDLWENGAIDDERVRDQLILYCGVMFGVSGASAGVRVLSKQVAETALKKLPQKALTKTFWFPILKKVGRAIGVKVTKDTVAKGASKAFPVIGGVISGGLNFASMMPMANRLHETLDKSCFDYTEEEYEADVIEVTAAAEASEEEETEKKNLGEAIADTAKEVGSKVSGFVGGVFGKKKEEPVKELPPQQEDIVATIRKLKELEEAGILTEEEFTEKKKELLARL